MCSFEAGARTAASHWVPSLLSFGCRSGGGVSPSWYMYGKLRSSAFFMQVIAAAGSDEKCKLAMQRGAQSSVNYRQGSLKEAVRKLLGSSGVDVVIDTVGGHVFLEALRRCFKRSFQSGPDLGLCEHLSRPLSSFWPCVPFVFAAHFSCRPWHQREQLSEWVERT